MLLQCLHQTEARLTGAHVSVLPIGWMLLSDLNQSAGQRSRGVGSLTEYQC